MDTAGAGTEAVYDAVVVGGGAAGLGAAVALSRARRSVLVIDAGAPRNAPAAHIHNYLGREGLPPSELLAIGRDEVASYGGQVVRDQVTAISRASAVRFRVERRSGPAVHARRVLVTTGLVDELPDIAGLAAHWGSAVLHCPYCHGWEVRDQEIVVIGTSPLAVHHALLWHQWSPSVTLILHDVAPPSDDEAEQLAALGIDVLAGPVASVESAGGSVTGVRLADGTVVPCAAIVVATHMKARAGVLDALGVAPADLVLGDQVVGSAVEADPMGATSVAGVFVAGNVNNLMDTVIAAAASGVRAAHGINLDLVREDARAAVARRRSRPDG